MIFLFIGFFFVFPTLLGAIYGIVLFIAPFKSIANEGRLFYISGVLLIFMPGLFEGIGLAHINGSGWLILVGGFLLAIGIFLQTQNTVWHWCYHLAARKEKRRQFQ